ncbi:MAG: TonB-dependent receptor [Porticoccaceae bacterium]|nr:TonB-dependent receptor [Porticoccaceae bacterium]
MNSETSFNKTKIALAVAVASSILPYTNQANADESATLEEIVVTATRREMNASDIPFNISAITGDEIEAANITDVQELMRAMPGITVADGGGRFAENNNVITIRGLNVDPSATDRRFLSDPTVSTYIGDTPVFANFVLKDIKRVEAMRGPQGTLYGSGSLGGTVRFVMNEPSTEEFDARIDTSIGTTSSSPGQNFSADIMLNIPLSDELAFRFSSGIIDNDGVIDYANVYATDANGIPLAEGGDVAYGKPIYTNNKQADTVDVDYSKAALKWTPNDDFEATLTYMNQKGDYGGRRQVTSGPDGWGEYYGDYEIGAVINEPSSNESEFTSLEMTYDLGFATLSSSTSQYDRSYEGISDNTGFFAAKGWLYWYGYGYMPRPAMAAERQNSEKALVQELRLVSNGDQNVDWTIGAFYMDQEASAAQQTRARGFQEWWAAASGPVPYQGYLADPPYSYIGLYYNPDSNITFDWTHDRDFTDFALFGEVTWNLSEKLAATVGARYFDNEDKVTSQTSFPIFYVYNPTIEDTQEDSDTLLKFNLAWDYSETTMVYGTISEGYRRGGTNAAPVRPDESFPNDPEWSSFGSDTVMNYEVGIKSQLDRLNYTMSAFYVDWSDPQVNVATPSGAYYAVANGNSASSKGIETEFNWAFSDAITMFGGYTYVDASLSNDLYLHDASDLTSGKSELRATNGAQLPGTPKNTINIGAKHEQILDSGLLLITRVDGYYQSDVENSILNIDPDWATTLDGFDLWFMSTTLVADHWTASLVAKNLFNERGTVATYKEEYMTSDVVNGFYGTGQKDFITAPRTITLKASYRF